MKDQANVWTSQIIDHKTVIGDGDEASYRLRYDRFERAVQVNDLGQEKDFAEDDHRGEINEELVSDPLEF